ncbi:MAG: hypothetical protein P9X27_04410 [Candidatus Kaelpia aquatica]|nr:hypothetical protein [Candidatus Kaelpia aquatica]
MKINALFFVAIVCFFINLKFAHSSQNTQEYKVLLEEYGLNSYLTTDNIDRLQDFSKYAKSKGKLLDLYLLNYSEFLKLCKSNFFFTIDEEEPSQVCFYDKEIDDIDKLYNACGGYIVSLPLVNIVARHVYQDSKGSLSQNNIFVIYLLHEGVNFSLLQHLLDNIIEKAGGPSAVVYIDELGLIPEDSVNRYSQAYKISEKESFEKIKNSLKNDIKSISMGHTIYDSNKLYAQIYSYFAKHKIDSNMEDLSYDNWKNIVAFDKLNLWRKSARLFLMGAVRACIESSQEFVFGFMLYNNIMRDANFSNQLKALLSDKSGTTLITIRGLGHFGFEKKLIEDANVSVCILGDEGDSFFTLTALRERYMIYQVNEVILSNEEEDRLLLNSVLSFLMFNYLIKYGIEDNYYDAMKSTIALLTPLSLAQLYALQSKLFYELQAGNFSKNNIYEFIYNWCKNQTFIKEEN